MGLKLAKILYLITQHVHTTFKISTSFISQNIPVDRPETWHACVHYYPTCTGTLSSLNRIAL